MFDDAHMRFVLPRFGALACVLLSQPVHAQTAPPVPAAPPAPVAPPVVTTPARPGVTLGQVIERFRRENLKLEAAKYEIGTARADVIAAGLLPNPRVAFDVGFRIHGDSQGADRNYQVMLAQSLPIWGRLGASKAAAELTVSATEREFAASAWDLLGDVRRAYLALQLAEGQQLVLAAGLADLERVQHVLDARAAAGANPAYDRVRLEVERGSLRARISRAAAELARARAELAAAIGGTALAEQLDASEPLPEPRREPRDDANLIRAAVERRHEIAASHFQSSAAEARVRATRKRFLPEPELGVGYARWSGIAGLPSNSQGGALLASASIPLPLFDRGQGTVERELQQSRAARVRERDVKNAIAREVAAASSQLRLTSAAYLAFRDEAAQSATNVRRIAEVTYKEGRGTILELLDAYSSYLRIQEQELELRGAALEAGVELQQALGPE
jgi:cobalt-zinc-cadmium efflux system outer membrane protein